MSSNQALAFFAFAVVAAITPGPANIILAATGAAAGVRRGLPCLFGTVIGMGGMMALVALGLGSLMTRWPMLMDVLRLIAVVVLLWLAWKIATASPTGAVQSTKIIGFWQAAAFQWVNPKSWLVSASAAGTFLSPTTSGALAPSLTLGLLFVLAALPSCFLWLATGATAQRLLRTERALRRFNVAMAALLAATILLYLR